MFVQNEADMTQRHAAILAEVAEICLESVRDLAVRQKDADDPEQAALLAGALHKVSRSLRQTLALEARLVREAQRALREDRDDAVKQRTFQTQVRRAKVKSALNQLVWNEYEGDEAEAWEMAVGECLDDEELVDSFTTEPLDTQVERIRKSIGLGEPEPPPPAPEPAPGPDRVPPPIDDDCWRSSA